MNTFLFFADGWPVFQCGGIAPQNAVALTADQAAEIQLALASGHRVEQDGAGYKITEPAPPSPPAPQTPAEKLAAAGLTVNELRQLLGLEVTP